MKISAFLTLFILAGSVFAQDISEFVTPVKYNNESFKTIIADIDRLDRLSNVNNQVGIALIGLGATGLAIALIPSINKNIHDDAPYIFAASAILIGTFSTILAIKPKRKAHNLRLRILGATID